jgi:hypothetical protein
MTRNVHPYRLDDDTGINIFDILRQAQILVSQVASSVTFAQIGSRHLLEN